MVALKKFGRRLHRIGLMPVYWTVASKGLNKSGIHYRDCSEFFSSWFANDTAITTLLWEDSKRLAKVITE